MTFVTGPRQNNVAQSLPAGEVEPMQQESHTNCRLTVTHLTLDKPACPSLSVLSVTVSWAMKNFQLNSSSFKLGHQSRMKERQQHCNKDMLDG